MDLGGAMFWSMDLDDFHGDKCDEGKFPLINTAKDIVGGKEPSTRSTTTRTTPTTTATPTDQSDTAALYCLNCKSTSISHLFFLIVIQKSLVII
jgi:hypothetical protein